MSTSCNPCIKTVLGKIFVSVMVCFAFIASAQASTCFLPTNTCVEGHFREASDNQEPVCNSTFQKPNFNCTACGDGLWNCNGCELGYEECGGNCIKSAPANGQLIKGGCYIRCNDGYQLVKVNNEDKCLLKCGAHQERNSNGDCVCVSGYTPNGNKCEKNCPTNSHASGDTCVCNTGYSKCSDGTCKHCPERQALDVNSCTCKQCLNDVDCSEYEKKVGDSDGTCSCIRDCEKRGYTVDSETKVKKCKKTSMFSYSSKMNFASFSLMDLFTDSVCDTGGGDSASMCTGNYDDQVSACLSMGYGSPSTDHYAAEASGLCDYCPCDILFYGHKMVKNCVDQDEINAKCMGSAKSQISACKSWGYHEPRDSAEVAALYAGECKSCPCSNGIIVSRQFIKDCFGDEYCDGYCDGYCDYYSDIYCDYYSDQYSSVISSDSLVSVVRSLGGSCEGCYEGSTKYRCSLNGYNITSQNQLCMATGYTYNVATDYFESGYTTISGGLTAIAAFRNAGGTCSACSYASIAENGSCYQTKYKCSINCSDYTLTAAQAAQKENEGYSCEICPMTIIDSANEYKTYRCTYGKCSSNGYTIDITTARTSNGGRDYSNGVYGNDFRSRITAANNRFYNGTEVYKCDACPADANMYRCTNSHRMGGNLVYQSICPGLDDGDGRYSVEYNSDVFNAVSALSTSVVSAYSSGYSDGYSGMSVSDTFCYRCPVDVTNQYYTCQYKGINVETTGEMCEIDGYQLLATIGTSANAADQYCAKCPHNSEYYKCDIDRLCRMTGYVKNNPMSANSNEYTDCVPCPLSNQYTKCTCLGGIWLEDKQECVPCRSCFEDTLSDGYCDSPSSIGSSQCTDFCSDYTEKSKIEGYDCEQCPCYSSSYAGQYKCTPKACPDEIKNGGYTTRNKTRKGYDCTIVAKCDGNTYYDCTCPAPKIELSNGYCAEDECPGIRLVKPDQARSYTSSGYDCFGKCEQEGNIQYGYYNSCVCVAPKKVVNGGCIEKQEPTCPESFSDNCSGEDWAYSSGSCTCVCEKSCSDGFELNAGSCSCYCPSGKIQYDGKCSDNQCTGTYETATQGYTCSGKCTQQGNPNYGKYKTCNCVSPMIEYNGSCIDPEDLCKSNGFTYTSVPTNNGYDCTQCTIAGTKYGLWSCKKKECPNGCSTGVTCGDALVKTTNGKSGEADCVSCVDNCEDNKGTGDTTSTKPGYTCTPVCTSNKVTYYSCISAECGAGYASAKNKLDTKCYGPSDKNADDGTPCYPEVTCTCSNNSWTKSKTKPGNCYTKQQDLPDGNKCWSNDTPTCNAHQNLDGCTCVEKTCEQEEGGYISANNRDTTNKCYSKHTVGTKTCYKEKTCTCQDVNQLYVPASERADNKCYSSVSTKAGTCYNPRSCSCTNSADGGESGYSTSRTYDCDDTITLKDNTTCYKPNQCESVCDSACNGDSISGDGTGGEYIDICTLCCHTTNGQGCQDRPKKSEISPYCSLVQCVGCWPAAGDYGAYLCLNRIINTGDYTCDSEKCYKK